MKSLKTAKALLLALATAAGSFGASTAHAENWIPIGMGDMLIFVPGIQFEATKVSYSDYQLSWIEQSGATSYKIERLTIDDSVEQTTLDIPTTWALVDEVTTSSIAQHHDISSFELGGHQTYRLSSCVQTTCTELDTISYFLRSKDMPNTIVQNLSQAEDVSGNVRMTTKDTLLSAKGGTQKLSENPYALGFGYSMVSGHEESWENRNENAGDNGHNGPNLRSQEGDFQAAYAPGINAGNPITSVVNAANPTHNTFLQWDAVEGASHYYITKIFYFDNVYDEVKKQALQYTYQKDIAIGPSFTFELLEGAYEFKVNACFSKHNEEQQPALTAKTITAEEAKLESGYCGHSVETLVVTDTRTFDEDQQVRSLKFLQKDNENDDEAIATYSEINSNGSIAAEKTFKLQWEQPRDKAHLKEYDVYGESQGLLATVTYDPALPDEIQSVLRSTYILAQPHMIPGRSHCYKVVSRYHVLNEDGTNKQDDNNEDVL
ncbi:MAG: hypothetical protein HRT35_11415, partial [Algicola sp.]|nr:hypothetical protein [Algicola sp.]